MKPRFDPAAWPNQPAAAGQFGVERDLSIALDVRTFSPDLHSTTSLAVVASADK